MLHSLVRIESMTLKVFFGVNLFIARFKVGWDGDC